jgi:hypothetical protein
MSRINRTQTYAALWLHSQGWSYTKIAGELELTEKQIENAVKKSQEPPAKNIKTASSSVGQSPSKNMMIRETANKNSNVTIMTKESSMINDEVKKKQPTNYRNNDNIIFRPNSK